MPLNFPAPAEFDELTDLPTMTYFRRYAAAYANLSQRFGRSTYLVYFNLKNFSSFNERYGFEEGDRLLRLVAVAIQEEFPGYLLSRFSEDHFFLVCESRDVEQGILSVAEQIHAYSRHANVELKAGIYGLGSEGFDVGVACDRAKVACESIAHRYDRTFRWFDDALSWNIERSQYIESHIDRAVAGGWIKVYLQPIVRTLTGKVCEFEALARWDDPTYGMLSPAVFVEVLEKAHLIHKLDSFVITRVCEMWKQFNDQKRTVLPISVNLSRLDFELLDVFFMVEQATARNGMPRQMLHIEVTESALNHNTDLLATELSRFRDVGYQVWLDDFGSGYSSLNTLKDYVFDVVKIDMAFLREFNSKPKSRVIIASIVNMAKQLGMQTLIEGVELPEQYDYLREIGCEFVQGYLIGRPAPAEENFRRVLDGELDLGVTSLYGYYDRLGAINMLSASPFDFPWEYTGKQDRAISDMLPLCVAEYEGEELRVITANQSCARTLQNLGLGTPVQVAAQISRGESGNARVARQAIKAAVQSGKTESVDLIANGSHCVMRVRHVVSHGDVDGLLVSVIDLSRFHEVGDETRLQIALQYLYAVYDEVNIVDFESGVVSTIYRGNTAFPATGEEERIESAAERFARDFVHPKDRQRCLKYLDMADLDERVEKSGRPYLSAAFRTLNEQGTYSWATSIVMPMVVEGKRCALICIRSSNQEVVSTMNGEEEISKALLWDTLLDLVPAGVFWKDRDRRFLGVNKNFLDFYSFESVNDVLGKTDEDMGWHVDVDPFKNYEYQVIQEGKPVLNAAGTCIAHGEVCDILASKIPLRSNGEVVGLMGYFIDRTNPRQAQLMLDGFDRMAATDTLTGIPNRRGLESSLEFYKEVYVASGIDFVCAVIGIRCMGDLNEAYGRSFGNRVLKVVASTLVSYCGVSGVAAHLDEDVFCVLRQITQQVDADAEVARLKDAMAGIAEVDGIAVHLRCHVGWIRYSQVPDEADAIELARTRMFEARRGA